jgi:hypothetical protein
MTARIIKADGTEQSARPVNGETFNLDELYRLLGCQTVEVISTGGRRVMVMDEDAKLKGRPRNDLATVIADNIRADDYIAGDVIVCPLSMLD